MKVGISYAVDLEEIPEELKRLIEEVQWDLTEKLDSLMDKIECGDFAGSFSEIKNMRHNLQRTDTRLEDCNTILNGYLLLLEKMSSESKKQDVDVGLGVRASRPGPVKMQDTGE
tara:strand:+ start:38 stop:379 length:342 start_codon:yes stop_codon:yes gene_type:complete